MSNLRQAAQQALEALERGETKLRWAAITALRAALAEPRPIQECYGDRPTDPATCLNPCNFEGRPKPEQKPQTTHWEGCEAVHPECRKPEPIQVSPTTFIQTVLYKEDTVGRPTIWAQWPNEEKNT